MIREDAMVTKREAIEHVLRGGKVRALHNADPSTRIACLHIEQEYEEGEGLE